MTTVVPLEMTGIGLDLPAFRYPPDTWTRARNVEMGDGFPGRARGYAEVYATPQTLPRWLQPARNADTPVWVYGGDNSIHYTDGANHFDITGAVVFDSSGALDPWSGGVMNENVIGNNTTGQPFYWVPGSAAALTLPGWDANWLARSVRVHREYLIAMFITDSGVRDPDLVRWSDRAPAGGVPQSWTPGTQSLAGSASAAFAPGELVDGLTVRDVFLVCKQHAVFILQLVGGRFVFQQRPLFSTVGMLARNCGIEWRGSAVMMTDGDVILTDANDARSLIDRRIKSAIFNNISTDNYRNSYLALDKERAEVWVCYPENGVTYPNMAAVWSILDDKWGLRELGDVQATPATQWPAGTNGVVDVELGEATWSERTTNWNTDATTWGQTGASPVQETLLFAEDTSKLMAIGEDSSFDGSPPTAELERTGLDLGDPSIYKWVRKVWPRIEGTSGARIEIRVGGQAQAESPVVWGDWKPFIFGTDDFVEADARGRYIALAVRSTNGGTWRAPGFDLELELGGRY